MDVLVCFLRCYCVIKTQIHTLVPSTQLTLQRVFQMRFQKHLKGALWTCGLLTTLISQAWSTANDVSQVYLITSPEMQLGFCFSGLSVDLQSDFGILSFSSLSASLTKGALLGPSQCNMVCHYECVE